MNQEPLRRSLVSVLEFYCRIICFAIRHAIVYNIFALIRCAFMIMFIEYVMIGTLMQYTITIAFITIDIINLQRADITNWCLFHITFS